MKPSLNEEFNIPGKEFIFLNDKRPYVEQVKIAFENKKDEFNEIVAEAKDVNSYPMYSERRRILFQRKYLIRDQIKSIELFLEHYYMEELHEKYIGRRLDYNRERPSIDQVEYNIRSKGYNIPRYKIVNFKFK